MEEEKTKKKTIEERLKKVNEILLKGEPNNISVDPYNKYTGYKPQYVIDAMNAAVGVGNWGFQNDHGEFIEYTVMKDQKEKRMSLAVATVTVWLKDVEFRPQAYGQALVTKQAFGDAKKGAQTDAIKKALSYFSIGNRAYHGKLDNPNQ